MLGDKIGDGSGKITSQRVLANPGGGPKMESSFQANGSLLGVKFRETGTYWTVVRPDGTLFGEGQGVVTTADGKLATWTGHGEQRRDRELPRCDLLSDDAPKIFPTKQGRGAIRIRCRRRRQHAL